MRRQSKIEPITRKWLDKHFAGIFKDIRYAAISLLIRLLIQLFRFCA
mgnify:CR=1 FL=1